MTSYNQTRLRHNVWKKTSHLRRLEEIWFTLSWRRSICDVFKTSDLRRLQDVWFVMSWRRLIYVVLKMSNLRRLEGVLFTTSWRSLNYDVMKTSVKRRLCSNVIVTSIKLWKKSFFLIFYCLKYSENFQCSSLG